MITGKERRQEFGIELTTVGDSLRATSIYSSSKLLASRRSAQVGRCKGQAQATGPENVWGLGDRQVGDGGYRHCKARKEDVVWLDSFVSVWTLEFTLPRNIQQNVGSVSLLENRFWV